MSEGPGTPHACTCLCGGVRFTAVPAEPGIGACHCSTCRRWSGGPFLVVHVMGDLEFMADETLGRYESSEWASRLFCTRCGSNLAYRMNDGSFVGVAAYAFEVPLPYTLESEVFIDEKPDGYAFSGDRPRLTGAEVFAAFAGGSD